MKSTTDDLGNEPQSITNTQEHAHDNVGYPFIVSMYTKGRGPRKTSGKVPLKASKFETKNGGKNHGRWFYTCQKPQHKRCNFFLWKDEAVVRETAAVLSNSRTEPTTPTKSRTASNPLGASLITLTTASSSRARASTIVSSARKESSDDYDFSSIDDDDLSKAADDVSLPLPETPRKSIKTDGQVSPGKRKYDVFSTPATSASDDIFTTPSTTGKRDLFSSVGMISPLETPTPSRFKNVLARKSSPEIDSQSTIMASPSKSADSDLETELLDQLRLLSVDLKQDAIDCIRAISKRHDMKTQGIAKGRNVSRSVIKERDVTITQLQARIDTLEAEKDKDKAVIRHLRRQLGSDGGI